MLAQSVTADPDGLSAFGFGTFVVFMAVFFYVLAVVPFIGIFQKAGKPIWAAFVPIYNHIVLLEVVGRPVWWILLYLVPFVNLVIFVIVMLDLAKSFGKGTGFAVGLILLSFIFMLILGFGSDPYLGPAASERALPPGPTPPPPPM